MNGRLILRAVNMLVLVSLSWTLLMAAKVRAAEPEKAADKLAGAWVVVGTPGNVKEAPKTGGWIKFFAAGRWCITQADPDSGKILHHHGGTYSLEGDKYNETIEYAGESTASLIKKTLTFTLKFEGDTLTQTGINNEFTEVLKRLK
jgi:hypothetical protein